MALFRRCMVPALALAAALVAPFAASTAQAAGPLPMFAAALNAGTVSTGIGKSGLVSYGIVATVPVAAVTEASSDTAVAGVRFEVREADPTSEAHAVTGDSIVSALLNAGTATTGLGPTNQVGIGIVAVR